MPMPHWTRSPRFAFAAFALLLAGCQSAPVSRMPPGGIAGYLCCTMHPVQGWISDINYVDGSDAVLAAGVPVRAVEYGNNCVRLDVGGKTYWLGNDNSRTVSMDAFTRRYVVAADPTPDIDAMSPAHRSAIRDARVMRGMTRRQVAMAVGYPIWTQDVEAPARRWTFWMASNAQWHVEFDDQDLVRDVVASEAIRRVVWADSESSVSTRPVP